MGDEPFLSRWSRRKEALRRGDLPPPEPPRPVAVPAQVPAAPAGPAAVVAPADTAAIEPPAAPPQPTLDEARALTPQSDFRRFVGRDVDPAVRHTALKTLFSDPHFNVMDGLDTYIEDYGRPDPIPAAMLARLSQSAYLGLAPPEPPTDGRSPTAPVSDASGPTTEAPPAATSDADGDPPAAPDAAAPAERADADGTASPDASPRADTVPPTGSPA